MKGDVQKLAIGERLATDVQHLKTKLFGFRAFTYRFGKKF